MIIEINLRDKNPDMVEAWKKEFTSYDNIHISCGHIFDIPNKNIDAIISPANSFGFMDGGIDYIYSEYFGWDLQDRLQKIIRDEYFGEVTVGSAIIIETKHKLIKYLISCPTMRVPEIVSDTVNAYLAFRAGLIEIIKLNKNNCNKNIKSILCPGLGTFVGKLSYNDCAKQMRFAYDQIFGKNKYYPYEIYDAIRKHYLLNSIKRKYL